MSDELLLDIWRYLVPVPKSIWRKQVSGRPRNITASLSFMSAEHHCMHNYVVRDLPRPGKALPPELIAQELGLPVERVTTILDELEKHMTFLYRDHQGAGELGLSRDGRAYPAPGELQQRRGAVRRLSGRCVCDALRARAVTPRTAVVFSRDRMRSLW